jgi:signal transduction histidine kinase
MFNLLGNAIKFTFKGSVNVGLDFEERNKKLTCVVKDTGIGID